IGEENICLGGSAIWTASGGDSYVWSTSETSNSITVSNAGTIIVTVTDFAGCTATASKTLNVFANPTAQISGEENICLGGSAIWTASGGISYVWSTSETSNSITVSNAGTVIVTVTDANGCTA